MAKPNVHTASRDELQGAGVRAELIDEIMKRRRRKGGIALESLDEVPGLGPATLDRLADALDFNVPTTEQAAGPPLSRKKPAAAEEDQRERRHPHTEPESDPMEHVTDAAEETLRGGIDQAADLVVATVQGGTEMAERMAKPVESVVAAGIQNAERSVSAGLQTVKKASEAAGHLPQDLAQRSAQDGSAFGQVLLELLQELGKQNMTAIAALARVRRLGDLLQIQSAYLHDTLERMTELNRRWLKLAATSWSPKDAGNGGR
jgi:ATP-dependent exoDNAse (exonuclease V) beta subunit